ncbi:type II toxin-antitoxin system VapC family toxin [Spirosoma taeanense]|uniref:Type II toxin-antitoxin system VapC family toxin n=1 Tax=Spirosoma taeanense TaxID=2735870 RepID=A0A6M5YDL7_9BACT|nr:type II toxin-antitoxin system VapC family toxin [Spirosoma taeanense]QJW91400.1 type II toxin-antitoxin system VapC family toxin [Spirosoma taeanense]
MNVLIDTQILIWIQENNSAVSATARAVLTNPENRIYISKISFFELAIKLKIGKLPGFQITIDELIRQTVQDGINVIELSNRHIAAYNQIPLYADHRDPFDRLLLATALVEKMPVISADEKFNRYQDQLEIIW